MIKIRIIPCLDVEQWKDKRINFVNLVDGRPESKQTIAKMVAAEITFLDITATHEKREDVDIIERTANECLVPLTVGGIRSVELHENIFISWYL